MPLLEIGPLVTSSMIIIYHFDVGESLIDPVCDVRSKHLGAFTWRRLIQPHPHFHAVASFILDEVVDVEGRVTPDALEEVITQITDHVFFRSMDHPEASRIIVRLIKEVSAAKETGPEDWGYHHSPQYRELIEFNRLEEERYKAGTLAPWELELMGATR